MKVLLVRTDLRTGLECGYVAPLGILYLAAVAERQGHEVRVVDLGLFSRVADVGRHLENAASWRPDVVGLSGLSASAAPFRIVAEFFRRRAPTALILAGGPFASSENDDILSNGWADYCVFGEGEGPLLAVLDRRARGESPDDLPALSHRRGGAIVDNPPRDFIGDLDALPFPAWRHHDFARARWLPGFSGYAVPNAPVYSSRGCPFECIFCHNFFGRRFRARSAENTLAEIGLLRSRYGVRLIEFIDDFFNFDRERTLAILRGIAERYPDLRIALTNGVRGDMLDEEIIEHIKRANCVQIGVAVETVSPRLQKLIRKNLDLEKLKETLRLLRKHRIQGVHTFFITGLPTETAAEAQAIRRFVAEQDLDYPLLFIAMPFNKKSPLYQMIPPDRLAAAKKEEGYCDYRWGNLTFGELPYAELEKMQMEFFLRRMLRRRNLPRFLSLVRGLLFRFFFRGDWMALRWIVEHLALRGSGENVDRARQRKLQKKRRDMQRLAAALGVAPARPTP